MLCDLAKAPKLASGDYHEVVKTLKKALGDSMVVVVATSANALGHLSKGLGKEFSSMAKSSCSNLFDRLKEKDKRVIVAVHEALDNFFAKSISIDSVAEDMVTAVGPKGAAKAKPEFLKMLKRVIDSNPKGVNAKNCLPIMQAVGKAVDDSTPDIREGAYACMASFMSAVGPAPLAKILEGMDEKKRKKIESMASTPGGAAASAAPAPAKKATIARKPAPAAAAASAAADAPPAPAAADDGSPSVPPPSKPMPAVRKSTVSKPAGASSKPPAEKKEDAEEKSATPVEQLDELVEQAVPADVREKLGSSNWKERLEAAETLETMAREGGEGMEHPLPEAIVRLLAKAVVDKKETNFQVSAKVFSAVQALAEKCQKFTKRAAHWFIGGLVEKLGDVKLRQPSNDCLLMLAEAVSPQVTDCGALRDSLLVVSLNATIRPVTPPLPPSLPPLRTDRISRVFKLSFSQAIRTLPRRCHVF